MAWFGGSKKIKPVVGTPSSITGGPGLASYMPGNYAPGWYRDDPQYYAGVHPATGNPAMFSPNQSFNGEPIVNGASAVRYPWTVTDGIDENPEHQMQLHYSFRQQPDRGGALNYSYDLYGLPLNDVAGPWMVAANPTRPIGSAPVAFFQQMVETSVGGLIPGEIVHQPLLDPNAPGSGYDYNG